MIAAAIAVIVSAYKRVAGEEIPPPDNEAGSPIGLLLALTKAE